MSRFDERRAESFRNAGITADHIGTAVTNYHDDAGGDCTLCGKQGIVYRYHLGFHLPDRGEVAFFPVGSKCILTWFESLPDSPDRAEAIGRVRTAEREMRRQQKVLRKLTEGDDEDGANLMRIFFRLPAAAQDEDGPLNDIAGKVERYGSFASDRQRSFFGRLVRDAAREHGVDDAATPGSGRQRQQTAEQALDPADKELLDSYNALPEGFAQHRGGALVDIAGKIERFGLTEGQRKYLGGLLKGAHALARYHGLLHSYNALPRGSMTLDETLLNMASNLDQFGTFRSERQERYFLDLVAAAEAEVADVEEVAEATGTVPVQTTIPYGAEEDEDEEWVEPF